MGQVIFAGRICQTRNPKSRGLAGFWCQAVLRTRAVFRPWHIRLGMRCFFSSLVLQGPEYFASLVSWSGERRGRICEKALKAGYGQFCFELSDSQRFAADESFIDLPDRPVSRSSRLAVRNCLFEVAGFFALTFDCFQQ